MQNRSMLRLPKEGKYGCSYLTTYITNPQAEDQKYLGMITVISTKICFSYWTYVNSSQQLKKNLLYELIIKPIWIYGIVLRGTASNSNTEIL